MLAVTSPNALIIPHCQSAISNSSDHTIRSELNDSYNEKLPLIQSAHANVIQIKSGLGGTAEPESSYEIQFIKNKRVTKIKLFSTEK